MRFIITYADWSEVEGTTREEFEAAPDGIQILRVFFDDGSAERYKGLDKYEYLGAKKIGVWTTRENFFALKAKATLP